VSLGSEVWSQGVAVHRDLTVVFAFLAMKAYQRDTKRRLGSSR